MALTRGAAARELRKKAHAQARSHVTELASTLLDPDLAAEARTRRAAPARAAIAAAFEGTALEARKILDEAGAHYLSLQPSALRLAAALKDPVRAAAMRQLADGMRPAELLALARLATKEQDAAAAYGIAAGLLRHDSEQEPAAREGLGLLNGWKTDERNEARADVIIAQNEVESLAVDRAAAEGRAFDGDLLMQVGTRLGTLSTDQTPVNDEDRAAAYKLAGIDVVLANPAALPESIPAGAGV